MKLRPAVVRISAAIKRRYQAINPSKKSRHFFIRMCNEPVDKLFTEIKVDALRLVQSAALEVERLTLLAELRKPNGRNLLLQGISRLRLSRKGHLKALVSIITTLSDCYAADESLVKDLFNSIASLPKVLDAIYRHIADYLSFDDQNSLSHFLEIIIRSSAVELPAVAMAPRVGGSASLDQFGDDSSSDQQSVATTADSWCSETLEESTAIQYVYKPIWPTVEEIRLHQPLTESELELLLEENNNDRCAAYLDRQFLLLREDMIGTIKSQLETDKDRATVSSHQDWRFAAPTAMRLQLDRQRHCMNPAVIVSLELPEGLRRVLRGLGSYDEIVEFLEDDGKAVLQAGSVLLFCGGTHDDLTQIGVIQSRDVREIADAFYHGGRLAITVEFQDDSFASIVQCIDKQLSWLPPLPFAQYALQASTKFFAHEPVLDCLRGKSTAFEGQELFDVD